MLPAKIEYYKPTNLPAAVELFQELRRANKQPMYFSGGTEILTFGRLNIDNPGSIIDIKGIPECAILNKNNQSLIIGASVPLTTIEKDNSFPLLTSVSSEIADQTARNKITIGGNICGKIFYREAVLPFLLADSYLLIASTQGVKQVPINTIFNKELRLEEGDLLVNIRTESVFLNFPFISRKIRKQWETGYPLITGTAMNVNGYLRMAFSGICPFPFRSLAMENEINNVALPIESRIENAINQIPEPILNDIEGSNEYRLFVLKNLLMEFLLEMEGYDG
ncbi:FAD binding domain-containing protein [Lederbergia wuyishanensis]|uniref:CO/xanthine dehydrogenase FAD-binding subunit n=1 Tax=Lederbergia wuyishanensis TaxID=1347903 RepID=A0ABU0D212_9BACI|nr:FAD binding domain-containing protein [Lederbergia wuyishanensis]MCJ8007403.1 FAD binding domain-containing protein [Lederbergia wuyishanensis]MDQ0342430.1 CO/xanthine dehydrogenase FAD-binding subunit [Lederbergia wuyishanensis]